MSTQKDTREYADPVDMLDQEVPTQKEEALAKRAGMTTARAAAGMRILGAPYADIATTLEYASPGVAKAAVIQFLAETYDDIEDASSLRNLTNARFERMLQLAMGKAMSPTKKVKVFNEKRGVTEEHEVTNDEQLPWFRAASEVMSKLAKLHGLDAPQVLTVHTPDAKEFDRVVQAIASSAREGRPVEADVFSEDYVIDAEEVDEDGEPLDGR